MDDRDISFNYDVSDNAGFVNTPDNGSKKPTDSSEKAKYNAEKNKNEVVAKGNSQVMELWKYTNNMPQSSLKQQTEAIQNL